MKTLKNSLQFRTLLVWQYFFSQYLLEYSPKQSESLKVLLIKLLNLVLFCFYHISLGDIMIRQNNLPFHCFIAVNMSHIPVRSGVNLWSMFLFLFAFHPLTFPVSTKVFFSWLLLLQFELIMRLQPPCYLMLIPASTSKCWFVQTDYLLFHCQSALLKLCNDELYIT